MQGLMQQYPLTLSMVFRRAERLFPDKHLVTAYAKKTERVTYGEWAERTRRLGGVLDELGVSKGGRVGTLCWNTASHLELYFAAPCSGRVLHTLNMRLFPDQLAWIINHAGDEVIFADRSNLELLLPLLDKLPKVRHVVVIDDGDGIEIPSDKRILRYEKLLAAAKPVAFDSVTDENAAAAMCYTSGTTGNPRGVVYSHRSIVLHCMGAMMVDSAAVSERDVILPIVPMFHANAWGLAQAAVFAGSSIVFPWKDLTPPAVAKLLMNEGVTLAAGVPTVWMGVLPELGGKRPPALDRILCGGSAVPKSLSEAYRTKVGVPITQAWGMTETSPVASLSLVRSDLSGRSEEDLADVRATAGFSVPAVEIRIADPTGGKEVAWDGKSTGELQAAGPWIADSYYDDAKSTESAFLTDGDGRRWLKTGDVATIDPHGYIHIVDRTKDLVKSGGEWISSVELENEIMAHPAVAEAAIIAMPHKRWSERPLACVVRQPGKKLTGKELLEWLAPRVAKWWLPDDVVFIDEVPKTSVGKFSKKDLRKRFTEEGYRLPTDN